MNTTPPRVPRILVVDDNRAVLGDFRKVLGQSSGTHDLRNLEQTLFGTAAPQTPRPRYDVVCVESGREALEVVRSACAFRRPFALAFVDMRMPGWDGVETVKYLWGLQSNLQVAICSAYMDYSWHEVLEELKRPGLRLIRKPWTSGEVLGVVHELLRRARAQSSAPNGNGTSAT